MYASWVAARPAVCVGRLDKRELGEERAEACARAALRSSVRRRSQRC